MEYTELEDRKVIVFQLGEEEYVIPVRHVGGIERLHPITRVPGTANYIKGVINLRGVVTPIIDLRTRFGMESIQYNEATRIIIVHVNEIEVGFIVDGANDVIDLPDEAIEPSPDVIGTEVYDYIRGVANLNERLLILLDLEKILTEQDIERTQQISRMEG
ncbi:purine-binding chemotaxis protein CheW [Cerasibacillus quisquiliarum]|uniref:Chemotaxis protein CheW n=1 Tax=Cerasibacillus quisquiliarum TaxID=227865 RepID=A0A511UV26_9BACI|nr:chemotaxis protein CheW [Cerasibacillus quisquiliarum]MBB5145878.1 purine-binding chemotaxis protein CheW [Cerasibacillus quisquiliarum]GEN30449.1 chemotaxis protein CheW [Cerasibacillus quisquiliarum]